MTAAIQSIQNKLQLDATQIKIIACVLMLMDHIREMFGPLGAPWQLTMLGRPVFVMFLFLMADSFYYTSNRRKLMSRLFLGSLFMNIFNSLIGGYLLQNPDVVLMNNAFSTFFLAVWYMWVWTMFVKGFTEKSAKPIFLGILLALLPVLSAVPVVIALNAGITSRWILQLIFIIPNVLLVEGGLLMIFFGLGLYILRERRMLQILLLFALTAFVIYTRGITDVQWLMVFGAIPMFLYNGEKGRGLKDFFYIFYPAHIYILYIVATLIMLAK